MKSGYAQTAQWTAVVREFGTSVSDLGETGQEALLLDVLELFTDEGLPTVRAAAIELRRRIGGPANLPSYVACLTAARCECGHMRSAHVPECDEECPCFAFVRG